MSIHRIGIDLGGTKIEGAFLSPGGEILLRKRIPSPARTGYGPVVREVGDLARSLISRLPAGTPHTLGCAIPGSMDLETGLVRNANSTCLIGRPLARDLEQAAGHPLAVRNDADCFTMAEARDGAGQGFETVFGVIMGTGCGGGIAVNGRVDEGPNRIRGEWGHVSLDPAGERCWCGSLGCVETMISGTGVQSRFARETGRDLDMRAIMDLARQGDEECARTFDRFLHDFGRALGGLVSILDPDCVVLGGGLSNIDELYEEGAARMRSWAFHDDLPTPVLKNELGDSAGVIGAAWIGI